MQTLAFPTLRRLVMWALTYRCNLRCQYCYLFNPTNQIALDTPEAAPEIVEAIAGSLTAADHWRPEAVWLTGGEPTLHPQLEWLVEKFESEGIMVVVTTDGVMSRERALGLVKAKPRGIMISLDLADPKANSSVRGGGRRVFDTIATIVGEKDQYTTLGVSVVIHSQSQEDIVNFASFLRSKGVDYLSLNPLHVHHSKSRQLAQSHEGENVVLKIERLVSDSMVALPSSLYLRLLTAHLRGENPPSVVCPAAHEYAFIAPWGRVYPCSCEFWHRDERMSYAPMASQGNFSNVLADLQRRLNGERFSSQSACYSTRCMGCWKLYYDGVFLNRS